MKQNSIKAITVIIALLISFGYENAAQGRMALLLALGGSFVLLSFLRGSSHQKFKWTLLIDVLVVLGLNFNSRFDVNYLYILFYLWIIIEAVGYHDLYFGAGFSFISIIAAGLSFYYSLTFQINYQSIMEAFIILFLIGLFITMLFIYKLYKSEKIRVDELNDKLNHQIDLMAQTNLKLEVSNASLESARETVEQLTRIKERSQLARDLHDTIGHELTGHIMSLEMIKLSPESTAIRLELQETIDHSREILRALRAMVEKNKDVILQDNFFESLSQKLESFSTHTKIQAKLSFHLKSASIEEQVLQVAQRCIVESLTNTAKHSQSKNVWVSIQEMDEGTVLIKIQDDGGGQLPIVLGNGLNFIKERVKRLGGTVTFDCDENGFRTTIKLPVKVGKESEVNRD